MKKTTSKRKASAKKPRKKTVAKKQSELEQLNLMDGKLEVDKVRELEELLGLRHVVQLSLSLQNLIISIQLNHFFLH